MIPLIHSPTKSVIFTLLSFSVSLCCFAADTKVAYGPKTVKLAGKLRNETDVIKGQKTTSTILKLSSPIELVPDGKLRDFPTPALKGVKELWVYSEDQTVNKKIAKLIGKPVTVTGTLAGQLSSWQTREAIIGVTQVVSP
jgi:hypothetical protein